MRKRVRTTAFAALAAVPAFSALTHASVAFATELPTLPEIFCNPIVRTALEADWYAGLVDHRERGRWVLQSLPTGLVYVGNASVGDENSVDSARPQDTALVRWVGYYHTHPPLAVGAPISEVGPSINDKTKAAFARVPSLVRDYTDTTRSIATDYVYGSVRRGDVVDDPVGGVTSFPPGVCGI